MTEATESGAIFMCHLGVERSRAVVEACEKIGIFSTHFKGGTENLSRLTVPEIKQLIPPDRVVYLIYDQGSPEVEYKRKEAAVAKLNEAGVNFTVTSWDSLRTCLRDRGVDADEFLNLPYFGG